MTGAVRCGCFCFGSEFRVRLGSCVVVMKDRQTDCEPECFRFDYRYVILIQFSFCVDTKPNQTTTNTVTRLLVHTGISIERLIFFIERVDHSLLSLKGRRKERT